MKRLLTLSVLFSLFASFCSAQSAYMKVVAANGSPIQGSVTNNSDHLKEIEIESYSNASGLCPTGNCIDMQEIVVRVPYSEPALLLLKKEMFSVNALQELVLSFQKRSDLSAYDYYKITMNDVVITSITEAAGTDGIVTQITFKPTKAGWTSIGQASSGKPLPPVKFGWDFGTNRAWTDF